MWTFPRTSKKRERIEKISRTNAFSRELAFHHTGIKHLFFRNWVIGVMRVNDSKGSETKLYQPSQQIAPNESSG